MSVPDDSPSIRIRADELRTVREAMRDLGGLLGKLEDGDVEKLVLTQRNRLRGVVVSVERWSEAEQALASLGEQTRARQGVEEGFIEPLDPSGR